MKKAMPLVRRLVALCVAALALAHSAAATEAKPPFPVDLTERCHFRVSTRERREPDLFDGDAKTFWKSGKTGSSYVQFSKPAGIATLSILWQKIPQAVSIEWRQDGQSYVLRTYSNAPGSEHWIPNNIILPENAGVYRLSSFNAEMVICELRMHEGELYDFFTDNGYPAPPVGVNPAAPYMKPIARNMRVDPKIRELQQKLKDLGFYSGRIDGVFSDGSYIALMGFQRANGIYPSGLYEPATVRALNSPEAVEAPPKEEAAKWPRTATALIAYAREHVGDGYVYGASGQLCTPTVRGAAIRRYPEFTDLLGNYARIWDGLCVYDCVGLIKGFLMDSEGDFPKEWNVNVTGAVRRWMTRVAPIESMPRLPGLLLLQEDPDSQGGFVHIGICAGEGASIHARGHRYGVVEEPMPQLWTHWAIPSWLDFDLPEEENTPWPVYMGTGTRVLVDSSDGEPIFLYSQPIKGDQHRTKIRISNYDELRIDSVPEAHYWRGATVTDSKGNPVSGYVFAKDLSLLE